MRLVTVNRAFRYSQNGTDVTDYATGQYTVVKGNPGGVELGKYKPGQVKKGGQLEITAEAADYAIGEGFAENLSGGRGDEAATPEPGAKGRAQRESTTTRKRVDETGGTSRIPAAVGGVPGPGTLNPPPGDVALDETGGVVKGTRGTTRGLSSDKDDEGHPAGGKPVAGAKGAGTKSGKGATKAAGKGGKSAGTK